MVFVWSYWFIGFGWIDWLNWAAYAISKGFTWIQDLMVLRQVILTLGVHHIMVLVTVVLAREAKLLDVPWQQWRSHFSKTARQGWLQRCIDKYFLNIWLVLLTTIPLQWRHNGRDSVSNHQPHDCLLNRLFRRRSKKTSKLRVTGLFAGNSPGEFLAQMASHAENVSIWWRHHDRVSVRWVILLL